MDFLDVNPLEYVPKNVMNQQISKVTRKNHVENLARDAWLKQRVSKKNFK